VEVLIIILIVVVALILGVAVIGLAFKLLWLALIGIVIGALARLVLPGEQRIGLLGTTLCGIGGSLLGGGLADALDVGWLLGFLIAIGVAAALIAIVEGQHRKAPV
jgi:uncharacterized membrane protein YeaQ/YmgE (transglycosylase-associated protein family)